MTNADKIRNMTDEQLAHFLKGFSYGKKEVDADKLLRYLRSEHEVQNEERNN